MPAEQNAIKIPFTVKLLWVLTHQPYDKRIMEHSPLYIKHYSSSKGGNKLDRWESKAISLFPTTVALNATFRAVRGKQRVGYKLALNSDINWVAYLHKRCVSPLQSHSTVTVVTDDRACHRTSTETTLLPSVNKKSQTAIKTYSKGKWPINARPLKVCDIRRYKYIRWRAASRCTRRGGKRSHSTQGVLFVLTLSNLPLFLWRSSGL
jgi:hypothetical protein